MPKKPDRSIKQLILAPDSNVPFVHAFQTPTDKDDLELYWAGQFVDAYNGRLSAGLRLVGRSEEPGDVLIERSDSTPVLVQVAEAINQHAFRKEAFKKRINQLVWTRDLAISLSGVKVVVCDFGVADKIDINNRDALKGVAQQIRNAVRSCSDASVDWLIGRRGVTKIELSEGCGAEIQLLRYAPLGLHTPAYYCWITALTMGTPQNHYFLDRVKGKLDKHYVAVGSEFWLLIYSTDCLLGLDEEQEIVNLLSVARNPFDKVFVHFDHVGVQVYPATNNTTSLPAKAGSSSLFALDSYPMWDEDKRWTSIELGPIGN